MENLETDEICDHCKKSFSILVKDFERAMKDGDLILCPDCYAAFLDEQTETVPRRCFEYYTTPIKDCDLNEQGKLGWELITIDNGQAYFKREKFEDI